MTKQNKKAKKYGWKNLSQCDGVIRIFFKRLEEMERKIILMAMILWEVKASGIIFPIVVVVLGWTSCLLPFGFQGELKTFFLTERNGPHPRLFVSYRDVGRRSHNSSRLCQ